MVSINRELHDISWSATRFTGTQGAFDPAMEALFQTLENRGKSIALPAEEDVRRHGADSWHHRLNGSLELTRQPGVQISSAP